MAKALDSLASKWSPEVQQLYLKSLDYKQIDTLNTVLETYFEITAEMEKLEAAIETAKALEPKVERELIKLSIAELRVLDRGEGVASHAALGEPKASREDIRICSGHRIVLHMCLKLLREPEKLEGWFFETSPADQRALRRIVLEHMRDVDQWLRETQIDVECRSILLGNTTIVLLQAEQMIEDQVLRALPPGTPVGQIGKRQPDEHGQWQSTNWEQPEPNTAREIHLKTLQTLRNLVDDLDGNQSGARQLESLVEVHRVFPTSHLWDRMRALVVYHSEEEPHWPLWDPFHQERNNKSARDIDDVIIYRCLMMILLSRTAADSSKILESGLWDKVVPMI